MEIGRLYIPENEDFDINRALLWLTAMSQSGASMIRINKHEEYINNGSFVVEADASASSKLSLTPSYIIVSLDEGRQYSHPFEAIQLRLDVATEYRDTPYESIKEVYADLLQYKARYPTKLFTIHQVF